MNNKNFIYKFIVVFVALIFLLGVGYQIVLKSKMLLANDRYNRIQDYITFFNEIATIEFAFFYEKDLKYQDRLKTIESKILELESHPVQNNLLFFISENSTDNKKILSNYNFFTKQYLKLLTGILTDQITLGLDHNKGLYGLLREHAHNFEHIVKTDKNQNLMLHMLMMRRHEKDFMLRGLEKYVTQYMQEYRLLVNILHKDEYKEQLKLLDSLKQYMQTFNQYVLLSQKIGENHLQGLTLQTKTLRAEFKEMSDVELNKYRVVYLPLEKKSELTMLVNIITFLMIVALIGRLNHEVKYAQERNPLTGLNGNRRIDEHLKLICSYATNRVVIYFDFDNFKPFNDRFGFKIGDEAIGEFANLLKEIFGLKGHFIGHIGGDDFIVIENRSHFEKSIKKIKKIQQKFEEFATKYYTQEERDKGSMLQKDRFGSEREIPLLGVSAAVVDIQSHIKVTDAQQISQEVSKIKKLSKENKITAVSITTLSKN